MTAAVLFAAALTATTPAVTPPAAAAPAGDGTTGAPRGAVATTPAEDQAIRDFWTPARRASATAVSVPVTPAPADPVRVRPAALRTGHDPEPAQAYGELLVQAVPPTVRETAEVLPPPNQQEDDVPVLWPDSRTGWTFPPGKSLPAPTSTIGALYFVDGNGKTGVCAATVVNSETRNNIITAGECVLPSRTTGASRPWNSRFLFTRTPLRLDAPPSAETEFTVSDFQTTPEWQEGDGGGELTEFNVAILVMNTNKQGQHIADVLGGQGLVINAPLDQSIRTFELRTDSETTAVYTCRGRSDPSSPGITGIKIFTDCYSKGVKPGYLGGPWLASYRNATGLGYVRSLTTGILRNDKLLPPSIGAAYGPSFGEPVRDLYNRMRNRGANDLWIPIGGGNQQRSTGIQIANLDATRGATVAISYLDDERVLKTIHPTIAAGSSFTALNEAPEGANTAHVTRNEATDTRLAAAGNHISAAGTTPDGSASSSNGFASGSRQVLLPLLMADNFGTSTRFTIQNTEWRDITVTISFQAPKDGLPAPRPIENAVIKARTARTWAQRPDPSAPVAKVFSAVVNATGNVAATVLEVSGSGQLEYAGMPATTSLSEEIALPLIQANNYGGYTGIQVQNPSQTDDAVLRLVYGANQAKAAPGANPPCGGGSPNWSPDSFVFGVPKNSAQSIVQLPGTDSPGTRFDGQFAPGGRPCRYIGTARIVQELGAQPVVAIVNQISPAGQSAYEGFPADAGTDRVDLPLIQGNNPTGQFSRSLSGIQIFNAGSKEAKFTIEYGANVAPDLGVPPCPKPPTRPEVTLPPDGALNLLYGTHDDAEGWSKTCAYVGSAIIRGRLGDELLTTVNQAMNDGAKDGLSTYNGLNFETLPPRFENTGP